MNSDQYIFYKISGFLALLACSLQILAVIITIITSNISPHGIIDWFILLQNNKFLGLVYLGMFDIAAMTLFCPMYIALYFLLKLHGNTFITMGTIIIFIGIGIFLGTNPIYPIVNLFNQYKMATTDIMKSQLLSAGQAILAIGVPGMGSYMAFLLIGIGALIVSIKMYSDKYLGKLIAIIGILANSIILAFYLTQILIPIISVYFVWISGLLYLVWFIMIGIKLLQINKQSH